MAKNISTKQLSVLEYIYKTVNAQG
ncbi:repressor LexA, partial [Enterococcus faecium]|nr:repressor LexA [Enterococcus faecium]